MKKLLRFLRGKINQGRNPYQTLVNIEISRGAILHNLHAFQKMSPEIAVAPVLKSNAYGHGLVLIAGILKNEPNIQFIVVDSYYEALTLRNEGIATPLLIIGYTDSKNIGMCSLKNIAFTVTSLDMLKNIANVAEKSPRAIAIHLKIDTGMHRQGILPHELNDALDIIDTHPTISLEGICSHLADAENTDTSFTQKQIAIWNEVVDRSTANRKIKYIHFSATHGTLHVKNLRGNVMRLGIGLYGLWASEIPAKVPLIPALSMHTIITGKKEIKMGSSVGYSGTFTAPRDMTIATIPVGYFEGLDRRLSNKGKIKIESKNSKNHFCQIIGKVSMNISAIDITSCNDLHLGSKVCVISNLHGDENSVESLAKIASTIPYEILVHIPPHLHRTLVK